MNDRMGTGMAEATRLTRTGQIIEATAVIQRTLRGMVAPDASSHTVNEPIDVPFHVFDAAPLSPEAARQGPDQQMRTGAVITLPPPDVAVSPHESGSASAERTDTRADLREEGQYSGAPPTLQRTPGRKRAGSTPAEPEWAARLRATLRSPHGGPGGPLSMPMPEQARSDIWAGGSFSMGPIPTMPDPVPISYTSPVAIAGKLCLWSLCSMAVRRPQRISPLVPV